MDRAESKQQLKDHLTTAAIMVFGLSAFGLYALIQPTDPVREVLSEATEGTNFFYDEETQLTFSYPEQVKESQLTQADKDAGIIGRLEQADFSDSEILITVRVENDLRTAANTTGKSVLDVVLNGINLRYPNEYPGFELELSQKKTFDGRNGADLLFSYDSPGQTETRIKQRMVVIETSDDQAVYINMQTLGDDFDEINYSIFQNLAGAVVFGTATINGLPHLQNSE
ncbi:MAG: hypothetical protein R3313_02775 [Candidatus Saccharimonadales bacterium]|nr:hypothetical protein [Candidatus Saccharimonadales bacterium]